MEKTQIKLHNDFTESAEFICHSILGKGQFSTAYLATRQSDGLDVILKKLTPRHPSASDAVHFRDAYDLQVELLNKTDNTAAPVIGFYWDENQVPWIALQKMAGDTLGKTAFQNLYALFQTFGRVAKGLGQFHRAGYLVIDLTPNNLFVLSDCGSMEGCYFFDFDAFVSKEMLAELKWIHSTRGFLAPEIKAFQNATAISEAADIYALGASLFYCLTGKICNSYSYFRFNQADVREPYKNDCTQKLADKLKSFFSRTLNPHSAERFSDWQAAYIALEELSDLADPKNRVRLHSNIILDVGEYYIPTPTQLQQLSDFFVPRLGQKAYAVIYGNVSGCGKTTLAKAFAKTAGKHYDSIQFCNYDPKSSWDGILSQVNAVNCPMDAKDHNEQMLNALRSGHQRTLIIIDNFDEETCGKPILDWGEETHVLFTSRYMADELKALCPCERVDMDCSQELSHNIFITVYSGLSGKTLTEKQMEIAFNLLEQVGYHTYASDLIARELAQHYRTEEGFLNFRENTHRLWQSKIASRKDRNAGEATSHETYQTYIELLFADILSKFTDSVDTEILFLFSLDRIWNKDILCYLVGDYPESGRFCAQDSISSMCKRQLIWEELTESGEIRLIVHPLIHDILGKQPRNSNAEKREQLLELFLSNFYFHFRRKDYLLIYNWPSGFRTAVDLLVKKYYERFRKGFNLDEGFYDYCSLEGLSLIHLSFWEWYEIAELPQNYFYRIPNMVPQQTINYSGTEFPNILLCSTIHNHCLMYFFHFPKSNETFPLVSLSPRYLGEEHSNVMMQNSIRSSLGCISVQQAIWHTKEMILPKHIHGGKIIEIYGIKFSWEDINGKFGGEGNSSVVIPVGIETIHNNAFKFDYLGCPIEEIILPQTIKHIGHWAFADARKLQKISFPDTLLHLGSGAFYYCSTLQEVVIPDNAKLDRIEGSTFDHCISLRSLKLPFSIKEICGFAFAHSGLEEITIANPGLKADRYAFIACEKLRTITAPKEWKAANRELLKSLPAYEPDENDPPEE